MPRYEFVKGTSSQFWEVELSGKNITTTSGAIGTDGTQATTTFFDEVTAQKKYKALIRSKVKKGFSLAADGGVIYAPKNEELERAIFEDRDDAQAWQVFGDWLQGQGDPRGEAIALSFAGDGGQLEKLIATHEGVWLGGLYESVLRSRRAPHSTHAKPEASVEWKHGFLHHVRIAAHYGRDPKGQRKVEALLELPSARFLHSLTIGLYAIGWNTYEGLAQLLDGKLPMLRHLHVGDCEYEEAMISSSMIPDVDELLRALPSLHSLTLRGGMGATSSLAHDQLRSMVLQSGGISPELTRALGAGTFPKLERLELWTGREEYGGYGPLSDYAPLLSGETCPALTHLGFRNAEQADEFVNVLAESALLPKLTSVDLSMGAFTPGGARNLITHRERYAHLTSLNVSDCCLGEDVVRELRSVFGDKLSAERQRDYGITFDEWDAAVATGAVDELDVYTEVGE